MPLRVLFVHPNDVGVSGGTIAMHRLRDGLQRIGIPSQILCASRQLPPDESVLIPDPPLGRFAEMLLRRITVRLGLNDVHALGVFRVPGMQAYRDADVLDIHCLHGAYFSFLGLPRLTRRKPVVLTLHDMWPLTGHCAFSFGCERWEIGCGHCPHLDVFPAVWRDATRLEWKLKRRAYRRSALAVVAPSRWLAGMARRGLFADTPIYHVPLGVDTERYRPDPEARRALGLPEGTRLILAAAASMRADRLDRKGGDLLLDALRALPADLRASSRLVVMGHADPDFIRQAPLDVTALGYVRDESQKARIYAAADCLVSSTRADNFPLVVIESLACGTPVASFAVGGIPEAVREGVTGTLAEPERGRSLADAIVRLLTSADYQGYRVRSRAVAAAEYGTRLHVDRMAGLYRSLVDQFAREGRLADHAPARTGADVPPPGADPIHP